MAGGSSPPMDSNNPSPPPDPSPEDSPEDPIPFFRGRPALATVAGYLVGRIKTRAQTVRRFFFVKIFLLLMGFFFANALSTVVGQTGDWDVLVAGFLIAMIESTGMVVHRLPRMKIWKRAPSWAPDFLAMVNYFKCGLIFGLFTDCFKVGS